MFNTTSKERLFFIFSQWLKRDLLSRYKSTLLGFLWPVLQPILQLIVFTFILHEFMGIIWDSSDENSLLNIGISGQFKSNGAFFYAFNVLIGLSIFNFFAEVLSRSPAALLNHPNLILKVKFPLELLPCIVVSSAFIHIITGFIPLLLIKLIQK